MNSSKYEKLLMKMPDQLVGFPARVLSVLEEIFGYSKMMFLPMPTWSVRIIGKRGSDVYRDFVTLNMGHEEIRVYRQYIRRVDIFDSKYLSEELNSKVVLFTSDILDRDEYLKTKHYEAMPKFGLEQQARISLQDRKGKVLANIVVFRNEKEAPFSEEERRDMEYISKLVSVRYKLLQSASDESIMASAFELLLKNTRIGSIVVNHRLTVIQANHSAFVLTDRFIEDFQNEHRYVLKNNYQTNHMYRQVQEVIDWIGLDLISDSERVYESISVNYHFYSSPFTFVDGNGDVQINHLILFYYHEKNVKKETVALYEKLTPREQDILRQIVSGKTNEEIAENNSISIYTVRTHVTNIYQKFNVNSRSALLLKFKEN